MLRNFEEEGTAQTWELSLGKVQPVAKYVTASKCGADLCFCMLCAQGWFLHCGMHCGCLLGREIRPAFIQVAPLAWESFPGVVHLSRSRLNLTPSAEPSSSKIWFCFHWVHTLCLANMHYFPSFFHSRINHGGKYLSTYLCLSLKKVL